MENLLFLGVPILKHITVISSTLCGIDLPMFHHNNGSVFFPTTSRGEICITSGCIGGGISSVQFSGVAFVLMYRGRDTTTEFLVFGMFFMLT